MTNIACWKCDKPIPKRNTGYVSKFCSQACAKASDVYRDRPDKEERVLQKDMRDARDGDTEAQEAIRKVYNVVGLLRPGKYATVEEALANMVRFG